jgi:hypothetical protein
MRPAPSAKMIAPSSPASRPSPPGGLRPALTPAASGTRRHQSGAGDKEDQQVKIHLTDVSTVWGDCLWAPNSCLLMPAVPKSALAMPTNAARFHPYPPWPHHRRLCQSTLCNGLIAAVLGYSKCRLGVGD